MTAPRPVLTLEGITKVYRLGEGEFAALKGVSFDVGEGEFVALMGPSGSGKSTLMNIVGILDTPTRGRYRILDEDVGDLGEDERAEIRNEFVGFVFQAYHLLPRCNLLENVEAPLLYAGYRPAVRRRRAMALLDRVGLADKHASRPAEISGGQKQRVAVARALAMNPALLLADEPTGNLDTRTGNDILKLFHELNADGATIVVVTHDTEIAQQARRIIRLRDGVIERDDQWRPVMASTADRAGARA